MGPKEPRSTTLSREEEAVTVAFRKHTLCSRLMRLPLRPAGHHPAAPPPARHFIALFQRHGMSRLPHPDAPAPGRQKFKTHPIGCFHVDPAEKWPLPRANSISSVAIDRTSRFAFARLVERADTRTASDFLRLSPVEAVPCHIHTVLNRQRHPVRRSAQESKRACSHVPWPSLRPNVPPPQHRTSPHQAQSPLDQRAG